MGNILLCANEQQKNFYLGALFGQKAISPIRYESIPPIVVAPFGIDLIDDFKPRHKPISDHLNGLSVKKILWFGGVYPWFDIRTLIDAVALINRKTPCHLTIVGARNPFNHHPDFVRISEEVVAASKRKSLQSLVWVADWVSYHDRFDWYFDADLLVTLNQEGIENAFAWRTRVVDYLGSKRPFATNGGDPLSEKLIDMGLAIRIQTSSPEKLAEGILRALTAADGRQVDSIALEELRNSLSWDKVGKDVYDAIVATVESRGKRQAHRNRLPQAAV